MTHEGRYRIAYAKRFGLTVRTRSQYFTAILYFYRRVGVTSVRTQPDRVGVRVCDNRRRVQLFNSQLSLIVACWMLRAHDVTRRVSINHRISIQYAACRVKLYSNILLYCKVYVLYLYLVIVYGNYLRTILRGTLDMIPYHRMHGYAHLWLCFYHTMHNSTLYVRTYNGAESQH